jgi:hypothetical protein
MADKNVEKASVDLRRYRERYVELKQEIKAKEAEAKQIAELMLAEADRLGLLQPDEGYSEGGTSIVLGSDSYESGIVGELRKRNLWQCISMRPTASAIATAVKQGKLPAEIAEKYRKQGTPYVQHREPKSATTEDET